jgi:hypothetical protein
VKTAFARLKHEGAGMILPLTMNLQERLDVARSEELAYRGTYPWAHG